MATMEFVSAHQEQDISVPHFIEARDAGLQNLRVKSYAHVNLDLPSRRAHALCAENKSGKTELLLSIAGRMHPSEGSLKVAGSELHDIKNLRKVRAISGLGIFERVNEPDRLLSVSAVTSAELGLAGKPWHKQDTLAYLQKWGLAELAGSTIEELPRYDYDLLGIALGMVAEPKILVVHDIERDLTEHQSLKLIGILKDIARVFDTTVVCGVCDYDLAAQFDTATALTDGARAQQAAWQRKYAPESPASRKVA